jgi:hypothetical protein
MLLGPDGRPARAVPYGERKMTEITRSFTYTVNHQNHPGGKPFESTQLFCSQKTTCYADEVEDASLALYVFCKHEVLKSRQDVIKSLAARERQER